MTRSVHEKSKARRIAWKLAFKFPLEKLLFIARSLGYEVSYYWRCLTGVKIKFFTAFVYAVLTEVGLLM
jgi:hypothetical protein